MLWIKFMITCCEIALRWMPQNTFNDKSTLVQIMTSDNKPLSELMLPQIYVATWI